MKIINAIWEKRNLDVDCVEILIEENDSKYDFNKVLQEINFKEYIVVKIPAGRYDLYEIAQKQHFIFIEGLVNLVVVLKNAYLSNIQHRLNQSVLYKEMNSQDLNELFSQIQNGIFKNDRIILDPNFSSSQATNRYINWITDELNNNSQVYKLIYKNDPIGFFTFKTLENGIYYPFLGGLYEKYSKSGLGFTILRKPVEEALKRNGKMISTYASTNNVVVLRAHTEQGFIIQDIKYVFVKHTQR